MKNPIKLAILCTAVCAAMLAFSNQASASNLSPGDGDTIGYVYFGIPSGLDDRVTYVNDLVGFYNSGCTGNCGSAHGQNYTIVNGSPTFGTTLPTITKAGSTSGGTNTVNLGSGYTYLFAKYDGPNQGSVVWYVAGMTGNITIDAEWGGYGLSGWTLFGPAGGVPDGGTTVMLLGAALGSLGMARRFLKR